MRITIYNTIESERVPSVVPVNAKYAIDKFVQSYRLALASLNIKAAEDDPTCTKAFDCSSSWHQIQHTDLDMVTAA